jgi:hypothetical protein
MTKAMRATRNGQKKVNVYLANANERFFKVKEANISKVRIESFLLKVLDVTT